MPSTKANGYLRAGAQTWLEECSNPSLRRQMIVAQKLSSEQSNSLGCPESRFHRCSHSSLAIGVMGLGFPAKVALALSWATGRVTSELLGARGVRLRHLEY